MPLSGALIVPMSGKFSGIRRSTSDLTRPQSSRTRQESRMGLDLFLGIVALLLLGSLVWWLVGVWKQANHHDVSSRLPRRTMPRRNTPGRSAGDWDAAYLDSLRQRENGEHADG
jgi:hypothetical protein